MKRSSLIPLLALWTSQAVFAQEQLMHPRKIYIDQKQHLYVQDSLPVYMFLSTSPDAKEAVQLKSEKTPKYANPMHFDGHGKHNLIHKDYDHEVEVTFEIYADGLAPNSHSYLPKAATFQKDGKLFCGKNLTVNLTSTDEMSGLENIYASINGAPYSKFESDIVADQENDYTIKYYAVDNVGNIEKPHTRAFTVDLTSPETKLSINGDYTDNVLSHHATLVIKSEDALSGVAEIKYKLDNNPELPYSSPIHLSVLVEGEHTITYHSIDHVKNKEEEKEFKFYVDKTPPLVIEDILGDKYIVNGKEYSSGRTKVKLTALDNKSGVKSIYYSIDGGAYQIYNEPFEVPSRSGNVTIRSYAVDNVMNKSSQAEDGSSKLKMSYVDLTGPNLSYSLQGPVFKTRDTLFISGKTSVTLKGVDSESGLNKITYTIDKKGEQDYAKSFTLSEEGRHHVEYSGYDNVNNSNNSSFYFDVDNSGPEIFVNYSILPIDKSGDKDIYPAHVVLFPSATDGLVGYDKMFYSINGAQEKIYTGVIEGFQKNKTYSIKIRALDKLGNESQKTISFKTESSKTNK